MKGRPVSKDGAAFLFGMSDDERASAARISNAIEEIQR
jgi:hypothetical protein